MITFPLALAWAVGLLCGVVIVAVFDKISRVQLDAVEKLGRGDFADRSHPSTEDIFRRNGLL